MGAVDDDRGRLAESVRARRGELGLTQADAAERAGFSVSTWRNIETADPDVSTASLTRAAVVLEWTPDSCQRILAGGEPEVARDDLGDRITRLEHLASELAEQLAGLDDQLALVLRRLRELD